ncbi:MAG: penicillin-binding protein 1A [Acidobacteria bacterium]|nr:penicillin-binding protein 1A [Acidobacteriota bacterium]
MAPNGSDSTTSVGAPGFTGSPPLAGADGGKRKVAGYALAAALAVAVLAAGYGWATSFDALIQERLTEGPFQPPVRIRAAPRELAPGVPVTLDDSLSWLRQAGYAQGGGPAGSYSVEGGALTIEPNPSARSTASPARIEFNDKGVETVETPDGRELPRFVLTPVTLTRISDGGHTLRRLVSYQELPANVRNAVIAIEDHRFFEHDGIDRIRTLRAAVEGLTQLERPSGTSTLTQQLARGFFLTPEQTYSRKLKELTIAFRLEDLLTKQEILEHYVNHVYMGRWGPFDVRGLGMAARRYFDRDIVEVTDAQAATLAGLLQRPSYLDPDQFPERTLKRRNQVLAAMLRYEYLSESAYQEALAEPLGVVHRDLDTDMAPYFTALAEQELRRLLPEDRRGFDVDSTLDLDLQRMAVEAVSKGMAEVDKRLARQSRFRGAKPPHAQVALVALDPRTGEAKALVGGRDFESSQLNRALARRQPGSAFKPFVYAAALTTGLPGQETRDGEVITAATILPDTPRTFVFGDEEYRPTNFGKRVSGFVTVREALAHSVNVPAVELAERVGYDRVAELAHSAGLQAVKATPSAALGAYETTPLELAGAFAMFANEGRSVKPHFLRAVWDNGEIVYRASPEGDQDQVLDPRVNAIVVNLMEDVINRGTAYQVRAAGFRPAAAGKTGTDDDGWFVGFTDKLVCAVWVGFDDNTDLKIEGGESAAPIWTAFMKAANGMPAYRGARSFHRPEGLEQAWVDVPARIKDYARAAEDRRAELELAGMLQEPVDPGGEDSEEPKRHYEPIPHREQNELFLPGTQPKPRGGFLRGLRFWK